MNAKLWVKFRDYNATKVSSEECQNVDDFLGACKKKLPNSLGQFPSGGLSLATAEGGPSLRPGLLLSEIPLQPGYAVNDSNHPLFISVVIGDDTYYSSKLLKKPRLSEDLLVSTDGCDFVFSDRQGSFDLLIESLAGRHKAFLERKGDGNLHPLPFLADGPGTGKSRFLQELPRSFRDFVVSNSHYPPGFQSAISNAVFINITFGNATAYCQADYDSGIAMAICRRIMCQMMSPPETSFEKFVIDFKSSYPPFSSLFDHVINLVSDMSSSKCIVLGVDEVNQIHSFRRSGGDGERNYLSELISLLGSKACQSEVFFVPVIAGTAIGPMKDVVMTFYRPLHIPLPLLSYDSCLAILAEKNPNYANPCPKLRALVSDIGGHGRSLEMLYVALQSIKPRCDDESQWNAVFKKVHSEISGRYALTKAPMEEVIAKSSLSESVVVAERLVADPSLSYQNLEERGLAKVENDKVIVSYMFACTFFLTAGTAFSKFWCDLMVVKNNEKNFWWQDWKVFNVQYIAFRLSLYRALGIDSIPLIEFFRGCKLSIPSDVIIQIPFLQSIKFTRIRANQSQEIPFAGTCVLNGDGSAPFDGFCHLNSYDGGGGGGKRLLLALQTKLYSKPAPIIITNSIIHEEYEKAKNAIILEDSSIFFIFLIKGARCDKDFNEAALPPNCAVVSEKEMAAFYGESYYRRLL